MRRREAELDAMPLSEISKLGDRCVEAWYTHCRHAGVDPGNKWALQEHIGRWDDELGASGTHLTRVESAALIAYVEAACGHRKGQRPRLRVWIDGTGIRTTPPGPLPGGGRGWAPDAPRIVPLEQHPTTCDDEERDRDPTGRSMLSLQLS